jgi:hypothetical protein
MSFSLEGYFGNLATQDFQKKIIRLKVKFSTTFLHVSTPL